MKNNLFFSFLSVIVFVIPKVSFHVAESKVLLVKIILEFNETVENLNSADCIISVNRNLQLAELGLERIGSNNKILEQFLKHNYGIN